MSQGTSPSTALTMKDLRVCPDQEIRVSDLRLAHRLGFGRATSIRVLIRRNQGELNKYGALHQSGAKSSGGRPGSCYLLNEAQALLVTMFARTERAAEARKNIIEVFMAFRHGGMRLAGQRPALGQAPEIRSIYFGRQLANRLNSQKKQWSDMAWKLHREHGFDVTKADIGAVLAYGIRRNENPEI